MKLEDKFIIPPFSVFDTKQLQTLNVKNNLMTVQKKRMTRVNVVRIIKGD